MINTVFLVVFLILSHVSAAETEMEFHAAMNPKGSSVKRRKMRGVEPMLHTFDVVDADGDVIRLDEEYFPGTKVWLIMNTASRDQFAPQFKGLEVIYQNFKHRGLEIIAFPSNNFGKEPKEPQEIISYVQEKFGATFPIMSLVDVNGENEHELFKWLKKSNMRGEEEKVPKWNKRKKSGLHPRDIHWNFEKFLVFMRKGTQRVLRFPFDMAPEELAMHVQRAVDVVERTKMEL
jgi:glutathione peroxidase